jgi:hypothetical protein
VTEVIGRKLSLNAILRQDKFARRHHACVVDEKVNTRRDTFDVSDSVADRLVREQVQRHDLDFDVGVYLLDGFSDWGNLGLVTTRENEELGICASQSNRDLGTDAGLAWAGDDDWKY